MAALLTLFSRLNGQSFQPLAMQHADEAETDRRSIPLFQSQLTSLTVLKGAETM